MTSQAVIVKFNDWETRCKFYRARPTKKKPINKKNFSSIGLDLSPASISLLYRARKLIIRNEFDANAVYAFADINCNLVVKFADDDFKHFANKTELESMFDAVDIDEED